MCFPSLGMVILDIIHDTLMFDILTNGPYIETHMLIFDSVHVHGNFIHFLSIERVIFDISHDSLMYLVRSQVGHKLKFTCSF